VETSDPKKLGVKFGRFARGNRFFGSNDGRDAPLVNVRERETGLRPRADRISLPTRFGTLLKGQFSHLEAEVDRQSAWPLALLVTDVGVPNPNVRMSDGFVTWPMHVS
jgi:hypothetical protein